MTRYVIQAHNRKGWDTEQVHNMEDVKRFLRQRHYGPIWFYIETEDNLRQTVVPRGLGCRDIEPWEVF